jgi:hypothetical protein
MANRSHLLSISFLLASLSWGDVLYAPPPGLLSDDENVGQRLPSKLIQLVPLLHDPDSRSQRTILEGEGEEEDDSLSDDEDVVGQPLLQIQLIPLLDDRDSPKGNARATLEVEADEAADSQARGNSNEDELEQALLALDHEWVFVPEASQPQGKVKEAEDSSDDEEDDEEEEECARYMAVLYNSWEKARDKGTYMPLILRASLQKVGRGLVTLTWTADHFVLPFVRLPKE